ncbi:deoxyribonucleoside kinase [Reticulomyxa filosa]|uniref:Deoxyribonucleoside kinase n=1 Tax=Reticulomyxa filosa TaxID=46433 RepID=X6NP28_RETFI|nr:deoxyribonucleoside kinase [Reticulomyxa filosa]|eukprot:ETO28030.1 deoxyribonucleoside kinase [Reticulomyxa filosa]
MLCVTKIGYTCNGEGNEQVNKQIQQINVQTFVLQTYAANVERALKQTQGKRESCVILVERSMISNFMFASFVRSQRKIKSIEWEVYQHLFYYFWSRLPPPDGFIFLNTSVDTAMARLSQRNRKGEVGGVTSEYQKKLQSYLHSYERELHGYGLPLTEQDLSNTKYAVKKIDSFANTLTKIKKKKKR